MDMSAAALPARYGYASEADQRHPLFPAYQQYRSSMSRLLVDSSNFRDWLYQHEQEVFSREASKHPRYPEFLAWIVEHQAGARNCPRGAFPQNFFFWLEGGRW
jgi:hypothetical protein